MRFRKFLTEDLTSKFLITLNKNKKKYYGGIITREIGCTNSYFLILKKDLEKRKIINCKKEGRVINIELTEKGKEIAYHLCKIKEIIK